MRTTSSKALSTAEGTPLPDNTRAELRRFLERLASCASRSARSNRNACASSRRPRPRRKVRTRWFASLHGSSASVSRRRTCWSTRFLSRGLRDRSAIARYAGLTGSPDESGKRRREKGLARAGNARVRCGMIQLAWRFLKFQKDSALAQWFAARTADRRGSTRKTMIVALARKLLIALWRLVTTRRGAGWHRLTSGIISDTSKGKDNRTTNLAAHARSADDDPRWR